MGLRERLGLVATITALALACESPPEQERCRRVETEAGLVLDCNPAPGDAWAERALEEAEEGMEERSPERRVP